MFGTEASGGLRTGHAKNEAGPGAVIGIIEGDPHAKGAASVMDGVMARLGHEKIVLPSTTAPSAIGRMADGRGRAIVVLPSPDLGGKHRSTYADRACRIAVTTRHPVILVPASTPAPWAPRCCVAAVDFGRSSITAALEAMALLEAPAEIVFAFVHDGAAGRPKADVVPAHVRILLDALPHAVPAPPGVQVTVLVLKGPVLPAVLAFATHCAADVLAFGRHGRSTSAGLLAEPVGPTVRGLLEGAPCSALVSAAC